MLLSFLLFALVLTLSVLRCVSPSTLYVITEFFTVINMTGVANLASSTALALGACLLIRQSICKHYTSNTAKSYVKWLR